MKLSELVEKVDLLLAETKLETYKVVVERLAYIIQDDDVEVREEAQKLLDLLKRKIEELEKKVGGQNNAS